MSNKNFAVEKQNIIDLFKQKKFSKISKISPKIRSLFEDQADIVKIIVMSDLNSKNFYRAENLLTRALIYNNNAEFNYILGNTLKIQDKNEEAINAFKKSISLNKNFSEAYNNLANVQKKVERFDDALLNYKKAISVKQDNLEAYYNLANLFKFLKNYDEAIKNYKNVIKLNPNFSDAYNNLGTIYSILGKFNDAKDFYIKSIKINKFFSEPYKNYVQLSKIDARDEVFKSLKEIVDKENLDENQKEVFFYSISKAYFDIGDNDLAFKYLNLANKLKLNKFDYSFNKEKKEFKKIKEFFSKKETINLNNFKKNKVTPIFILGMPRSGTSLIEQIVSNHSEVHGAGELDLFPISVESSKWQNSNNFVESLQKIRKGYLEKISLLSKKNYITDKLPGNFKRIGFILSAIPESKIIHLERNPMAVCWSNYRINFRDSGMEFALTQNETAEYYILYDGLMKFWLEKFKEKIINVEYEKFVSNYELETKNIIKKLSLNWEDNLKNYNKRNFQPIETASLHQVREKIVKNTSEKWKIYKDYLNDMQSTLKSNNIIF